MDILLTGATGFIGSALIPLLVRKNYNITVLTRNITKAEVLFNNYQLNFVKNLDEFHNLDSFSAVINLAGEPIFDHRWTNKQKQRLIESRIKTTEKLTALINQSISPPNCFISSSATGYYGNCYDQIVTENIPPKNHFVAQLCSTWENVALQAETRVCLLRTGLVLDNSAGVLAKMLPLYRLGLGGKLGHGKQYWSWIALEDMISAVLFLLENKHCYGAFNCTAPTPVTNAEFNHYLGAYLNRPHFINIPASVLSLFSVNEVIFY